MTEYDLFVKCIPMIAGMAVRCRRMSRQDYEQWKQETMEHAPEMVKEFVRKVFIVINSYIMSS